MVEFIKKAWVISEGGSKGAFTDGVVKTSERSEAELNKGIAQLISYGALFLANPDLPKRFELGADLNTPDRNTMFGGGVQGYTDYPFLQE